MHTRNKRARGCEHATQATGLSRVCRPEEVQQGLGSSHARAPQPTALLLSLLLVLSSHKCGQERSAALCLQSISRRAGSRNAVAAALDTQRCVCCALCSQQWLQNAPVGWIKPSQPSQAAFCRKGRGVKAAALSQQQQAVGKRKHSHWGTGERHVHEESARVCWCLHLAQHSTRARVTCCTCIFPWVVLSSTLPNLGGFARGMARDSHCSPCYVCARCCVELGLWRRLRGGEGITLELASSEAVLLLDEQQKQGLPWR